jgi:spore germination cell wall hydrolase CwlJ-like protein
MLLSQLFDVLQIRPSPFAAAAAGASLLATGMSAGPTPSSPVDAARNVAALPVTAALQRASSAQLADTQGFSADQARLWNASLPAMAGVDPAARPFFLGDAGALSQVRASDCLTAAVYYEAAHEGLEGQRAVAQVVLNRLRHPVFPKTVCGVVFQGSERATGCQFTFTCDGALARTPSAVAWINARAVADAALAGYVERSVGRATHYHADYVAPDWSTELVKITTIGRHIFYRWSGRGGPPPALEGAYAGREDEQVAERMRPDLVSVVKVEVEPSVALAASADQAVSPAAWSADAPEVIEDVAARAVASAAELTAVTPGQAYKVRNQGQRETRAPMPASLF